MPHPTGTFLCCSTYLYSITLSYKSNNSLVWWQALTGPSLSLQYLFYSTGATMILCVDQRSRRPIMYKYLYSCLCSTAVSHYLLY